MRDKRRRGRGSSGDFLPHHITGLKLWTRLNQGITETGLGVSQWDDASGNGNHLLQATDAARPQKQADGSILFNGVDEFLKANAFTLVQPETIYILGKQVTWTDGDRIFDGNTLNSGATFQVTITPSISLFAGAQVAPNTDWILDTNAVLSSVINGASSLIQIGAGTPTTGNPGAANMGGFTLGAHGGGANFGNIQVKEVLVYNTAHDAAQRSQVINYLQGL